MKKLTFSVLIFGLIAFVSSAQAQSIDPYKTFKKHINSVVEEVEQAESADAKRAILNESFDDVISAIEQVEASKKVPEADKGKLAALKRDFQDKKNELNGTEGFSRVQDVQLNNFANFVQQDLEQADRVLTISLTTALLVVIILLLL